MIDLATGSPVGRVSPGQAAAVAHAYANDSPSTALLGCGRRSITTSGPSPAFDAERPLYHFGLGDEAGTELYVSSVTGHAVQVTTARERFWNWLGSMPHWLYFAELRHNAALWSQVVIATSLLGAFWRLPGSTSACISCCADREGAGRRIRASIYGITSPAWCSGC